VKALWEEAGHPIATPLPRMRYAEAMERYGTDKPDLRYGLELFDATEVFRAAEFGITRAAIGAGDGFAGSGCPAAEP